MNFSNFEWRSSSLTGDKFLWRLIFAWIHLRGCKFCHILLGFIFGNGKFLIILRGLIFTAARYVMFMCSMRIAGKTNFCKIIEDAATKFVIRSAKKEN